MLMLLLIIRFIFVFLLIFQAVLLVLHSGKDFDFARVKYA